MTHTRPITRVALIGPSGTGKSSIARLVAAGLGWSVVDIDDEIERQSGRTIPMIFQEDGEPRFRELEGTAMRSALPRAQVVIATGGGAVLDPGIWDERWLGAADTLVIGFDAPAEVLLDRLSRQAAEGAANAERPLLAGDDPLARLERMRRDRRHAYSRADVTLDVCSRALTDIAADIVEMVRLGQGQASTIDLVLPAATSRIFVGTGTRHSLAETIAERWPDAERVWVGIDERVEPLVADIMEDRALQSRFDVRMRAIPHGEASKSLAGLSELYDWMIEGGVRRGDVAVALGGGMVGDLMGFAAATVLRGIGLVQMPTTLLSMVDSSVGGKTGINHPGGKNLIGAFHQASRVLIDPDLLATLPEREFRSGWAEIVKHAVIQPSTPGGEGGSLLATLERNASALRSRSSPLLDWVIGQNVALKAAVVMADERESNLRAILNFGHTIGHAIEAADYRLLHGEAVAVGMRAALLIARQLDLIDAAHVERVTILLAAFGLPATATANGAAVRARLRNDKKVSGGRQTWVLPVREGGVALTQEVPDAAIEAALALVLVPTPDEPHLERAGR